MLNFECLKNYTSDGNNFVKGNIYKAEICGDNNYYLFINDKKIWLDFNEEDIGKCFAILL